MKRFNIIVCVLCFVLLENIIFFPVCASEKTSATSEIEALTKMLWGEARGIESDTEKAACCWVVLNRVDDKRWPNSVIKVLSQKYQFGGYNKDNPVDEELYSLAEDVYDRWILEKDGEAEVGRVIPDDYFFWCGDRRGKRNYFWQVFDVRDYYTWWMESPYED